MAIMLLSCPKCGYEIERDIEIIDTCIHCGERWTPLYPAATVAMDSLGHLRVWRGFLNASECTEKEPDVIIQSDQDVAWIIQDLSVGERYDVSEGWPTHTNFFNPEYFQVSNG